MIYKNEHFYIDTDKRKVFDENLRELKITGNAFRLLVFLCEKGHATITDINDYFDPAGAKDYSEDHVRQYRYRINSIISHDVVRYENKVYSLEGKCEEIQELPDRNTDLLRSPMSKLRIMDKNSKENLTELLHYKDVAVVVAAIMSILAIATWWPYGYYIFFRWVVSVASALVIYTAYKTEKTPWVIAGAITLILWNPFAPVSLSREIWSFLNIAAAGMFIGAKFKIKE